MAVPRETLPESDKYRGGWSQPNIGMSLGVLDGGVGEGNEGAEGLCSPMKGATVLTGQIPWISKGLDHQRKNTHGGAHGTGHICGRGWPDETSVGGEALGT